MLRPNLADHPVSDFQHWPPWRPLVATATDLARFTGQYLIAPQTILARAYLEQIFAMTARPAAMRVNRKGDRISAAADVAGSSRLSGRVAAGVEGQHAEQRTAQHNTTEDGRITDVQRSRAWVRPPLGLLPAESPRA